MRLFIAGFLTLFLMSSVWMINLSPILEDDMDYHMKIIYINEKKLSYNEATHACAILNATLLTMRSWQKWFMVQQLFNSSSDWDKQATVEAWIGLTNTIYGYNWIDCVSLDFDKFSLFKGEGDLDFKSSEQCYRVKEGHNFRWEQKKCSDDFGAICEQRIHGGTCVPEEFMTGGIIDITENDETSCKSYCADKEACYAMIHYNNGTQDNCISMKKTSAGPTVNVKLKQCITGEIKSLTDINTGSITISPDNNETPSSTCSNTIAFYTNAVSPAISTSTVTVTPSTVDTTYIYTSCFNITATTTETFMNNLTTYIPQTTISYVQSLLTTTMTTMVPTTIVYTTILAPSTVTVQLTPSPTSCQERTTFINITNTKYIEEAMENITKALYVDKKQISSYVRSKTCADDKRPSAATVGYFGIVFIAVPFGLIFLLDLRSIFAQMRDTANHCQLCYDSDE
uniref:C-type lectin domain-containing protein n=1 Tax=Magallana gigas TaxID=29159 RepID=A0A8W8INK5_MAGGI|nr:uncharacterized protein LOC105341886 [Crassostrea gigas]